MRWRGWCVVIGLGLAWVAARAQEVIVGAPVAVVAGTEAAVCPAERRPWQVPFPAAMLKEAGPGYALVGGFSQADGTLTFSHGNSTRQPYVDFAWGRRRAWVMGAATVAGEPVEAFVWRSVIFNPPACAKDGAEAVPRLLAVEPVFLTNAELAAGGPKRLRTVHPAELAIGADGVVTRVTLLEPKKKGEPASGRALAEVDPALQEKIERVVKRWRFAPARAAGEPVAATVKLPVTCWLDPYDAAPKEAIDGDGTLVEVRPFGMPAACRAEAGRVVLDLRVSAEGLIWDPVVREASDPSLAGPATEIVRNWWARRLRSGEVAANLAARVALYFRADNSYLPLADPLTTDEPPRWRDRAVSADSVGTDGKPMGALLELEIDAEGRAGEARVVFCRGTRTEAEWRECVRGMHFEPGRRDGAPAAMRALLPLGAVKWLVDREAAENP